MCIVNVRGARYGIAPCALYMGYSHVVTAIREETRTSLGDVTEYDLT